MHQLVQSAVLRFHVVCPSVALVDCDHIGWNSSEIISPLVSLGCSLSADPNMRGLFQGEHPEILAQSDPPPVDLSVGDIWSQIAAKWLQISQRSQWRAYNHRDHIDHTTIALSNGAITDSLRPPLPPKWGFRMPPRYANGHISATGDPIHFMFCSRVGFSRSADRMVLFLHQSQVGGLGGRPPSWIILNGHISATAHTYIVRGHLCDSTAFLFIIITQVPAQIESGMQASGMGGDLGIPSRIQAWRPGRGSGELCQPWATLLLLSCWIVGQFRRIYLLFNLLYCLQNLADTITFK